MFVVKNDTCSQLSIIAPLEKFSLSKIDISKEFNSDELVSIGDRINYNLRKSVAISFNSTDATNKLYNPVFSQHYVFTTANVKWV